MKTTRDTIKTISVAVIDHLRYFETISETLEGVEAV